MLDKWTYVNNRELFFDINPYLNNLQVILRACNRYLKWIGFEKCAKPINGGPTLSGLIGGFAGDLQRLYPVQSTTMFPLTKAITPYQGCLVVTPLLSKEKTSVKQFCQDLQKYYPIQSTSMPNSLTKIFATSIADQTDSTGFLIEDSDGEGVLAFLVATKSISSLLKVYQT